jgi:hypothetical protein
MPAQYSLKNGADDTIQPVLTRRFTVVWSLVTLALGATPLAHARTFDLQTASIQDIQAAFEY